MTRKSASHAPSRPPRLAILLASALFAAGVGGAQVKGQIASTPQLRQEVERRFDVLTVQDGLALKPKSPLRDVRWVEVSGGVITVNGAPVSGAELRDKLGDTASLVMQLSYLDPVARATMFRDSTVPTNIDPSQADRAGAGETRSTDRGQFKLGGSITVPAGKVVSGDLVTVGGAIHVFGEVDGDVVAIGGPIELGPAANVSGDVTVIGGGLQRDPTARVRGEVVDIGAGSMQSWRGRLPGGRWQEIWGGRTLGSAVALLATLTRVAVLCLLAALVLLLGRDHVVRIGARAAAEPLKAGAIGLLTQLLLAPLLIVTILLLIVTIIGIPLLMLIPVVLLGLAVVALVGFTSVAHYLGQLLSDRFQWGSRGPYATTVGGILILVSPLLLARVLGLAGGVVFPITFGLVAIGTILEYIAWTIGFGAAALVRFDRSGHHTLVPHAPEEPGLIPG